NHDPSKFSLVRDFALYIFFLLDVVSIFRVQSRGPIRSCNNNITMTTHSLTQCWRRALWVTQVVCVNGNNAGRSICERYLFLSKRKSWPDKKGRLRGRKINHLQSYQATSSVIVRLAQHKDRAYLNILW